MDFLRKWWWDLTSTWAITIVNTIFCVLFAGLNSDDIFCIQIYDAIYSMIVSVVFLSLHPVKVKVYLSIKTNKLVNVFVYLTEWFLIYFSGKQSTI